MIALVAVVLITLHGPDRQRIDINPNMIVSVRKPLEHNEGYFKTGVSCVLSMVNSKIVSVIETCDEVRAEIGQRGEVTLP